jgi:hypothetical protein
LSLRSAPRDGVSWRWHLAVCAFVRGSPGARAPASPTARPTLVLNHLASLRCRCHPSANAPRCRCVRRAGPRAPSPAHQCCDAAPNALVDAWRDPHARLELSASTGTLPWILEPRHPGLRGCNAPGRPCAAGVRAGLAVRPRLCHNAHPLLCVRPHATPPASSRPSCTASPPRVQTLPGHSGIRSWWNRYAWRRQSDASVRATGWGAPIPAQRPAPTPRWDP